MRSKFQFCALVSVVALCGCSQHTMKDHKHPVTLYVQAGTPYTCKYTGGDDGQGNLQISSSEGKNVTIPLHLHAGPKFRIAHVDFQNDLGQLSQPPITNPKEAVIKDKNDQPFPDGYYSMTVEDVIAPDNIVSVTCDPKIVNN